MKWLLPALALALASPALGQGGGAGGGLHPGLGGPGQFGPGGRLMPDSDRPRGLSPIEAFLRERMTGPMWTGRPGDMTVPGSPMPNVGQILLTQPSLSGQVPCLNGSPPSFASAQPACQFPALTPLLCASAAAGGKPCVRAAGGFDPVGFSDVVRVDGAASCTGIRIQRDLVLTAAHCVTNAQQSGPATDVPVASLRVHVPEANPATLASCKAALASNQYKSCMDFRQVNASGLSVPPEYKADPFGAGAKFDVALIRLPVATPALAGAIARLDFALAAPGELTLSGYGKPPNSGMDTTAVEIGWNKNVTWQPHWIRFKASANGSAVQSQGRGGDSGGPILAGRMWGAQNETHRVIGVFARYDSATSCAVRLGAPPLRKWLCETNAALLSGTAAQECAKPQPIASAPATLGDDCP